MSEPIDVEFTIVSGLRRGESHPEYKAFVFTGQYEGEYPIWAFKPMWINRHPWITAILIGLGAVAVRWLTQ